MLVAPARLARRQRGRRSLAGRQTAGAPISADETLKLVYLPTGNATPDWYGGHRRAFDDKFSSSVVGVNADSGAVVWSFQTTHHDLWDYDVPSQPTLYEFPTRTGRIPALIQPMKNAIRAAVRVRREHLMAFTCGRFWSRSAYPASEHPMECSQRST